MASPPPKKKRRSGDAAALGMTKEEEYYRPATLSHGGQGSYHGRAAGDSLELTRGLDSHGFADLDYAVSYCCSLASVYPMGDVRRQFWNQGTKEQLFLVMEQVWLHVAPTSERITEDLEHLLGVVKNIRPRWCCGA